MRNSSEQVNVIASRDDRRGKTEDRAIDRVWPTPPPRRRYRDRQRVASHRRGEIIRKVEVQLPANVTGSVQLTVDAVRNADDRRDVRRIQRVADRRTFNRQRRNNRLYVRIPLPNPARSSTAAGGRTTAVGAGRDRASDRNSGAIRRFAAFAAGWGVSSTLLSPARVS